MMKKNMKRWIVLMGAVLLCGCAAYGGYGLKPGKDGVDEVVRVMGQPALRWQEPDGSLQLAYPRGPMGFHTYMAHFGADGRLLRIENVMDEQAFARIQPGMTQAQVLRILGPSVADWSAYFKARDELVWEWRHCNVWNDAARFNVLFDNSKGTVRSTMSQTEVQMGLCDRKCVCGR